MTALALTEMTEKEWSTQVAELARMLGWKRYHTYRSKHSAAGWPDEALVRDRLVMLELKTQTGKVADAQREWIAALLDAGIETYVARPSDLDPLAKILACRGNPFTVGGPAADAAALLRYRTCQEVPVPAD